MRAWHRDLPDALRRAARVAILALLAASLTACWSRDPGDSPGAAHVEPPTVYTVERGDTLYSIATHYGLDHKRVAAWNGIGPPYTIYPGQKLRLRPPVDDGAGRTAGAGADGGGDAATAQSGSEAGSKRKASGHDWAWPVTGEVVRGYAAADYGKKGIAIGGELGAPVRAADSGRVVYSGNGLRGYGNLVIVKHDATYLTAYGYNQELTVGEGDDVDKGDPIGRLGKMPNGNVAIHFELRRNGEPVNPLPYLPKR